MAAKRRESAPEIRGKIRVRELLDHFGPVPLGDAGDNGLFRGEVAVKVARAHAGFRADRLHRRLVEPGAAEAALRGSKDFGTAVELQLGIGAAHGTNLWMNCAVRQLRANVHSHNLRT